MTDAFEDAWDVSKFDSNRAEFARQMQQAEQPPYVGDDEYLNLNIDDNQGDCCENLRMEWTTIFELANSRDGEIWWDESDEAQAMYPDNWLELPCEEMIAYFNNVIKRDLSAILNIWKKDLGGRWSDNYAYNNVKKVYDDALEALERYNSCVRGGFKNVDFDDNFQASGDAFEDAWGVSKEFYFEQQDYQQPYSDGRKNRKTGKVVKKPSRDIRGMKTARRWGYNVSDKNYRGDAKAGQWATTVPQKGRRLSDAWNPSLMVMPEGGKRGNPFEQSRRDWRAVNLSRYGGLSEEDAIHAARDKMTHEAMHTALEWVLDPRRNKYENRPKEYYERLESMGKNPQTGTDIYIDAAHELGAVTGEVSARNDRSPDAARRLINQMHPIKRPVPASKRTRVLRNIARKNPLLRAIGRRITKESREVINQYIDPTIMSKGIIFGGKNTDDINDVDEMIRHIMATNPKHKPPLPWGRSGRRVGMPWKKMREYRLAGEDPSIPFITNTRGFRGSSEMLPTVLNWEGGKTQIQPQMRALSEKLGAGHLRPAELFGGSGSFVLGQNRGEGFYNDLNPDLVTTMLHLKDGMKVSKIPQNQEELERAVDTLNELRYRRDVLGEDLDYGEERQLVELLVGSNMQHRNGMFQYKDWDTEPKGYTEGFIKRPSFRKPGKDVKPGDKNFRYFPFDAGSIDLTGYADRMKNFEIHQGDFRDAANLLGRKDNLYLDPQYISRDIDYGGTKEQKEGKDFDQLQRDVIRVGEQHEGPSIISNYMYGKDSGEPLYAYIEALLDAGYDIHPWLRKPKANNKAQAELLALRGFPEQQNLDKFFNKKL